MSSQPMELSSNYDGRKGHSGRRSHTGKMSRKLVKENTERAINRVGKLIDSPDDRIALETCKFVIEQCIGRAPLRDDMRTGAKPNVDNRLQIAIQSLIVPRASEEMAKPTLELAPPPASPGDPSGRKDPPSR